MSLLDIFINYNQRRKEKSGIETVATFTGKRNIASKLTKMKMLQELDYYEYEIEYEANGEIRKGYYIFHPLPDPSIEEIEGMTVRIRYNQKKPYIFERVNEVSEARYKEILNVGLAQAKTDESRPAGDVFSDLRKKI